MLIEMFKNKRPLNHTTKLHVHSIHYQSPCGKYRFHWTVSIYRLITT